MSKRYPNIDVTYRGRHQSLRLPLHKKIAGILNTSPQRSTGQYTPRAREESYFYSQKRQDSDSGWLAPSVVGRIVTI